MQTRRGVCQILVDTKFCHMV